jgi:hypothetical protein
MEMEFVLVYVYEVDILNYGLPEVVLCKVRKLGASPSPFKR